MDLNHTQDQDLIILDDSGFGNNGDLSGYVKVNESTIIYDNIFPLIIILLVVLCEISLLVNIVYIFIFRKYNQSASHHILTHFMIFKFLFCFTEFFNILSSVAFETTDFHLRPTSLLCFLGRYSTFFFETSKNFQLVLIWIVLLSERKLIGFRCLISDFELKKYIANRINPRVNLTSSTGIESSNFNTDDNTNSTEMNGIPNGNSRRASTASLGLSSNNDSFLTKLREKNFRNFLILNSRTIVLISFYGFISIISLLPFSTITAREFNSTTRCSMYRYFDGFLILLVLAFLFLFFLPTFYWLVILSTIFSKLFGGIRDPLLSTLSESDLNHLKFIKIASILKFVENFFLHVISTHDFLISKNFYEITRLSGLGIILITSTLYMILENVLVNLKRSLFSDDSTNRISYFVFRNREADEEAIVYRNLVENA
jgi:hypothetical protein